MSIAIIIGYTARKNKLISNIARLISLGYAIPNAIIAISIIMFLSRISSFITQYIVEISLVGTIGALVYSYLFRFFAISLKAKVSKEWHQITIENLVKEIAQKHGYGHKVAEEFKNVLIPHINQVDESDISLLTKIATEREAMAKLAGGYILFISKNMAKSATGRALGTMTIRPQDTINWKVHFTVRDKYNSVSSMALLHSTDRHVNHSEFTQLI